MLKLSEFPNDPDPARQQTRNPHVSIGFVIVWESSAFSVKFGYCQGVLAQHVMKLVLSVLLAGCNGQDLFLAVKPTASQGDLVRAQTRTQSGGLAGSNPQEIAEKINGHLRSSGMQTKDCDSLSVSELNDMVRSMWPYFSTELESVYKGNVDLRAKRFSSLADYESSWATELEHDMETLRHAKCHEVVMMWAHHLSETAKKFWKGKDLPTLPAYDAKKADNKVYATSTTCQTGHKMVAGGGTSTHKWPDWPEELHYTAKAHGAYPFWWGGGSDSGVADMEVWWSEKQGLHECYWRPNVYSIVRLLHWHEHTQITTNQVHNE